MLRAPLEQTDVGGRTGTMVLLSPIVTLSPWATGSQISGWPGSGAEAGSPGPGTSGEKRASALADLPG